MQQRFLIREAALKQAIEMRWWGEGDRGLLEGVAFSVARACGAPLWVRKIKNKNKTTTKKKTRRNRRPPSQELKANTKRQFAHTHTHATTGSIEASIAFVFNLAFVLVMSRFAWSKRVEGWVGREVD